MTEAAQTIPFSIFVIYMCFSLPNVWNVLSCLVFMSSCLTVNVMLSSDNHRIFPQVMFALLISAAGASSAIVYLAHNGNLDSNWLAICMQYSDFCQTLSGAVVASFVAAVFFMMLVVNSTFALKK